MERVQLLSAEAAAYSQFRKGYHDRSKDEARANLETVTRRIAELQKKLGWEQFANLQKEEGLLFAWSAMLEQNHCDVDELLQQPWLKSIGSVGSGGALRIVASLADRKRLVVDIHLREIPTVRIHEPTAANGTVSRLFQTALNALLDEGRLCEIVRLAAQRLGLELASHPANGEPPEDGKFRTTYMNLRSTWLTGSLPVWDSEPNQADITVRELEELYHSLYVLDRQIYGLAHQEEDLAQETQMAAEWESLKSLPGVQSISIDGNVVEFITTMIYIDGYQIGEFRILLNFKDNQVTAHNLTRLAYKDTSRYDHPHIHDGYPCLGNIYSHVQRLMITRNLPDLIGLLLDFLHSYNPASPYCTLDYWS